MSSGVEGGRGGGHGVTVTKKMLQNIKEIVGGNFSDDEIYASLKECNMDPSETVHRLLNQDTFHEVKSKKEKKKEIKDNVDSRLRGANNSSSRGGKGTVDRTARIAYAQANSSGNLLKSIPKKENGPNTISSYVVPVSGVGGTSTAKCSVHLSDSLLHLETINCISGPDGSSSFQYSGIQNSWAAMSGQRTLADVVKMGRPPAKISRASASCAKSDASHSADLSASQYVNAKGSGSEVIPEGSCKETQISDNSDVIYDPTVSISQYASFDEWPVIDPASCKSGPSILEPCVASCAYADPSTSLNMLDDGVGLRHSSQTDEIHGNIEDTQTDGTIRPVSVSERHTNTDYSGTESGLTVEPIEDVNSFQSQVQNFEHHEGHRVNVDVSSAADSLQQLCLDKDDASVMQTKDNPAVIIPSHLQVTDADCLHLSFGSFGSGTSAILSGSFSSRIQDNHLEMPSDSADSNQIDDPDSRNPDYFTDEQLRPNSNEDAGYRPSTDMECYETPSSPQPDIDRSEKSDTIDGHRYQFQSSVSTFSDTIQPTAAPYASMQGNSQMQNLASFSSVMQAYTSSLSSNLLGSTVASRESDLSYSSLLAAQSAPTKYSTALPSISGPVVSAQEALKPGVFTTSQPVQQNLTATPTPAGPTLQHLHVHPYSQPALPLGHFANMIGYPFLPQSYQYVPSAAFQQAYSSNNAYHQPPAGALKYTLPQYKTSAVSSLPQSAAAPSGLGGFGNSASIPANFMLNPSTGSVSSTIGYDDNLSAQLKESSHYAPQQNESSAMWLQGAGSRTMSALPASTYYSLQAQNLLSGFRQNQQPSHYGAVGYPNFYHSQASAVTQEQQASSDGRLSGSQGPLTQNAHQIWQHNY